jgi:hypothetical protein
MTMKFGKYKGIELEDLPNTYLAWLVAIDLREPLRSAVDREYEFRYARPFAPASSGLAIRLPFEQLPLARRVFDLGYRTLARRLHPDHGGNPAQMLALNALAKNLREQFTALETGVPV